MQSMTGFGRGESKKEKLSCLVELRSVNSRFLDISSHLPEKLSPLEMDIKKLIQRQIKRGKVTLSISLEGGDYSKVPLVDKEVVKQYLRAFRELKKEFNLDYQINLSMLSSLPGVITFSKDKAQKSEVLSAVVLPALKKAIDSLVRMRKKEGDLLLRDIRRCLKNIKEEMTSIKLQMPKILKSYRGRLRERVKELTPQFDESRLLTEIAIIAERGDINEELVRLQGHLTQFKSALRVSQPIGRKLDFLLQEMNREVNTIGSKAPSLNISQSVIKIKSELEKIREQVQNIE